MSDSDTDSGAEPAPGSLRALRAAAPPRRIRESTNDYTDRLPIRRHSHEAGGMLLFLPRTGLVVVPFKHTSGGWDVAVVVGDDTYRRGGYHLHVGDREIETGVELDLSRGAGLVPEDGGGTSARYIVILAADLDAAEGDPAGVPAGVAGPFRSMREGYRWIREPAPEYSGAELLLIGRNHQRSWLLPAEEGSPGFRDSAHDGA